REMLAKTASDNFSALIRHEIERARSRFRDGAAGTCWLDGDGSRMAAAVFMSLQIALLDRIELDPGALLRDDFRSKPASLASQLRQLPRAWRIARRQAADPLPNLR
ncbi:MAG: 15-cis-phytoene synthase, partial [Humisphaera sp.]|nr:15-cis-phytoene synthase [Humisphaera sp.]